jgi:hypothetical protein
MNELRLIIGASGSGKSTFAEHYVVAAMERGDSVIVVAPHQPKGKPNFGENCVKHALARGFQKRMIVDYMDRTESVPQYTLLPRSTKTDYFARRQENAVYGQPFYEAMASLRGKADFSENPILEKNARLGISTIQNNDEWCPPYWICNAFKKESDERAYFEKHTTDKDVKELLTGFKTYDPKKITSELEPGQRQFTQILKSPMIQARTCLPPTFNYRDMFNKGYSFFFIGGMDSPSDLRIFIRSQYQLWAGAAKEGISRTLSIFYDEANNYGFLGHSESKGYSTLRAYSVSLTSIIQSFDFQSEEIQRNILQNANLYWLRQGDEEMAFRATRSCLGFLDPMKVHHQDVSVQHVHAGVSTQKRTTHWKGDDGRGGESESFINTPIYQPVENKKDVFQSGSEQLIFNAQMFLELGIGEVIERPQLGKPFRYYKPMLSDPFVFPGLGDAKLEKFLAWLYTTPYYRTPKLMEPPAKVNSNGKPPQKNGTTSRKKSTPS